jgi:MFS transporter, DHA3 family, macrolide efflux protein
MTTRAFRGQQAFWTVWFGLMISFTGSALTRFGVSVWVFQETRDAQAFATLLFFSVFPLALGSLLAGPLIDRWDRRRVLIVSNVIASLPTVAVMLLLWFGDVQLWHLYVALFVNGLANAFILPSFDSSIRLLVAPHRLGQASGYAQMIQTLGIVVAPPIAGFLMVTLGLGAVFAIDVVTVVVAVIALLLVEIPRPPPSPDRGRTSLWEEFLLGVRYVGSRPPYTFLLVLLAAVVFASSFTYALSGPLVLSFGDEGTLGLIYAAYGIGSVAGALAMGATGGTRRRMHALLASMFVMSVGTALASLRPDALWIGAGVFVSGMAQAVLLASDRTIYQEHVPLGMLGRVFSLRFVCTTAAQSVGLLAAGYLAAQVFEPAMMPGGVLAGPLAAFGTGPGRGSAIMLFGTAILLLTIASIAASVPRIRGLEARLDAPTHHATEERLP